jgi:hypothetical protein
MLVCMPDSGAGQRWQAMQWGWAVEAQRKEMAVGGVCFITWLLVFFAGS